MKKWLSLLLAMLMFALPVCGTASEVMDGSFTVKYVKEGQRDVTDVSLELSDIAYSLMGLPEETVSMVRDLLAALKLELSGQSAGGMKQGSLRILLSDQDAANVTVALGENGIYAGSNFLGDKIVMITPDQMNQLSDMYLASLVEQGKMTQEQLDSLKSAVESFKNDPAAMIAAFIGEADPTAMLQAMMGLISFESEPEELTEVPEGIPFEAKYAQAMVIHKDALDNFTAELAKYLWSMPGVQKLAGFATTNGEPMTEESLTSALNSLSGSLAEDLTVKIYFIDENMNPLAIAADPVISAEGETVAMNFLAVVESKEDTFHMNWNMKASGMDMTGDMTIVASEETGKMDYLITAVAEQDGQTFTPISESIQMEWTKTDVLHSMIANVSAQITSEPGADPVTIVYDVVGEEKDLGDHAEQAVSMKVGLDGIGDLMTILMEGKTDLAEAYIVTDDAVQPMAMSEEEMAAFTGEIQNSAMAGLMNLMQLLPASVQQIAVQLLGGGSAE